MKRALIVLLLVLALAVACQPKMVVIDDVPMTRAEGWKHTNSMDIEHTHLLRVVDREYGNVCYSRHIGGGVALSRVPLRERDGE